MINASTLTKAANSNGCSINSVTPTGHVTMGGYERLPLTISTVLPVSSAKAKIQETQGLGNSAKRGLNAPKNRILSSVKAGQCAAVGRSHHSSGGGRRDLLEPMMVQAVRTP